jgi:hypothetical protein
MVFVFTDLVNEPIEYRHEAEVFGFAAAPASSCQCATARVMSGSLRLMTHSFSMG